MVAGNPNFANASVNTFLVNTTGAANANYTGLDTGSTGVTFVTFGSTAGTRITRAWWMPTAASTNQTINWFLSTGSTLIKLIASSSAALVTPSSLVPPPKTYEPTLAGFNIPSTAHGLYHTVSGVGAGVAGLEVGTY